MVGLIPEFTIDGLLPPQDYSVTLAELKESILVHGPSSGKSPAWDGHWRAHLCQQLEILALELWQVGIENIFIDGSFAEDKDHPNDIDGYFECDRNLLVSGELERKLNSLDPFKVWTWNPNSRRQYPGFSKAQLPMWHRYRVELYPHFGQLSGIRDEHGSELEFPAAFRKSRISGMRKGIVKLLKERSI